MVGQNTTAGRLRDKVRLQVIAEKRCERSDLNRYPFRDWILSPRDTPVHFPNLAQTCLFHGK
jgi:hypothetical protein